jgi:DNA-binding Lrp family transcriptional regulator
MSMKLDRIDRIILRALQKDCRVSAESLGELAGLSPSATQRRVARLRDAGVIAREVAVIPPNSVGRPLLLIVQATLRGEDSKGAEAFRREMRDNDAVMQCYFVTGDADYVFLYAARDMEEFDAFVKSTLLDNPHVVGTRTNVVMRPVKMTLAVPIDEEERD